MAVIPTAGSHMKGVPGTEKLEPHCFNVTKITVKESDFSFCNFGDLTET